MMHSRARASGSKMRVSGRLYRWPTSTWWVCGGELLLAHVEVEAVLDALAKGLVGGSLIGALQFGLFFIAQAVFLLLRLFMLQPSPTKARAASLRTPAFAFLSA
jgi:hypothetical protein